MERVKLVDHKGKRIFFVDFSNCSRDEALHVLDQAKTVISGQAQGSLLGLTDVTNGHFDRRVTQALREYANHAAPYVRASALVGVNGMQRVILMGIETFTGRKFTLFDDVEQAKEWLAQF